MECQWLTYSLTSILFIVQFLQVEIELSQVMKVAVQYNKMEDWSSHVELNSVHVADTQNSKVIDVELYYEGWQSEVRSVTYG